MANGLDEFLQHISSHAGAGAGFEEGMGADEETYADAAAAVALPEVTHMVDVPVQNGQGTLTSEKVTSWGVTIEGTVTVTAPANGTWNITATDLVYDKVVYQASGLGVNESKSFSYKTGFHVQLSIAASWSVQDSTTLVLELNTNH
jgi:hypothetical protein